MTFLAESYLHSLNPVILPIYGDFAVRWYGMAYLVGFLVAWWLVWRMARSGRSPLQPEAVGDLMMYLIVGVLVGGRVGFALFYQPTLLWGVTGHFPFWDLLAINKGGMSSHGGFIGVIFACMLFARRRHVSALHLLDMGTVFATPGLFFGRLANFVNAELWGKVLPASMQTWPPGQGVAASPWWSVKYPGEITERWLDVLQNAQRFPADVVAATQERINALDPLRDQIAGSNVYQGIVDAAYAGDQTVCAHITPLLTAYYPSQIIQAITDGPILLAALALIWLRPRRPGVVGAWFLMIYGVLRIATEVVRQPDQGVDLTLGLSRGQVLSVLMVVSGIVGLWIVAQREVEPIGGLCRS